MATRIRRLSVPWDLFRENKDKLQCNYGCRTIANTTRPIHSKKFKTAFVVAAEVNLSLSFSFSIAISLKFYACHYLVGYYIDCLENTLMFGLE